MFLDKKRVFTISIIILVALLVAMFIPFSTGRVIASIILIPSVIVTYFFVKKKSKHEEIEVELMEQN